MILRRECGLNRQLDSRSYGVTDQAVLSEKEVDPVPGKQARPGRSREMVPMGPDFETRQRPLKNLDQIM